MILAPEQWDYRNSWAPMNSFIIQGLLQTGQQEAVAVAKELAKIWVKTNYLGFQKHKQMFEKVSCPIDYKIFSHQEKLSI